MIIGLTGSSGSGKSTVAEMLKALGFFVVDCDAISKSIDGVEKYKVLVEKNFGREVFNGESISREKLGKLVFSDKDKLRTLTKISHPIIIELVISKIKENPGRDIIIDAPLLFESGLDSMCDTTIGIIADETLRSKRVMIRDGISEDYAYARISSQQSPGFYKTNCAFIIENNGDIGSLENTLRNIIENIKSGEIARAKTSFTD